MKARQFREARLRTRAECFVQPTQESAPTNSGQIFRRGGTKAVSQSSLCLLPCPEGLTASLTDRKGVNSCAFESSCMQTMSQRRSRRRRLFRNPLAFLDWILDRLERREFAVVEFSLNFLHFAEIDVLDNVAGLRVD